jgi:DNA-binding CsgD family transcriptional regulator
MNVNEVGYLSKREFQVINMIAQGKRLKDISIELKVKQSTIATYKHRVFEKLNVTNVIEMNKILEAYYGRDSREPTEEEKWKMSIKILREQAEEAFIKLFGEDDIDWLDKALDSPIRYRRFILEKFSRLENFYAYNIEYLSKILIYISRNQKFYEY